MATAIDYANSLGLTPGTMPYLQAIIQASGGAYPRASGGRSTTLGTAAPVTTLADTPKPLTEAATFFDKQPDWTYYEPMDPSTMQSQAQQFSDIYAQPMYGDLERKLSQAIADAAAQEQRIKGAFAGTEAAFGRREQEQSRLDLESAISRGAGRSGVVDYKAGQRQDYYGQLLAAEEAKKNAEMYGIANQLGLVQRQVPEQRTQITEQASRLANQELQRLRDMEYQKRMEHDLNQWERMLSVFDRTMLTPVEQLSLYLQMAETMGKTTANVPSVYGQF